MCVVALCILYLCIYMSNYCIANYTIPLPTERHRDTVWRVQQRLCYWILKLFKNLPLTSCVVCRWPSTDFSLFRGNSHSKNKKIALAVHPTSEGWVENRFFILKIILLVISVVETKSRKLVLYAFRVTLSIEEKIRGHVFWGNGRARIVCEKNWGVDLKKITDYEYCTIAYRDY